MHLFFFSIYTPSQACPALLWSLDAHLGLLVQTDAISRMKCFVLVPLAGAHGPASRCGTSRGLENTGARWRGWLACPRPIKAAAHASQTFETERRPSVHRLLWRLQECVCVCFYFTSFCTHTCYRARRRWLTHFYP